MRSLIHISNASPATGYSGTSLIKKRTPLKRFLMGEALL